MTLTMQRLGEIALKSLGEEELRGSAVYLDPRVHSPGSTVTAGRQRITVRKPSVLVFIDLAPAANWGHPCRYLLIDAESGAVESLVAHFPPPREAIRLLHRGDEVKDWMLLTQEQP